MYFQGITTLRVDISTKHKLSYALSPLHSPCPPAFTTINPSKHLWRGYSRPRNVEHL
jgi:hypothetical protein